MRSGVSATGTTSGRVTLPPKALPTKGLVLGRRTQKTNPLVGNNLRPKKNFQKTCLVIDKIPPMVSNIQMKNRSIYTLTLDYTPDKLAGNGITPTRSTKWVRQTHREAMRKVRYAVEHGDHEGYTLQSWKLDSGWQRTEYFSG